MGLHEILVTVFKFVIVLIYLITKYDYRSDNIEISLDPFQENCRVLYSRIWTLKNWLWLVR